MAETPVVKESAPRCQAIKSNRMQCNNPAYVMVNNIPYCRLDFNWLVGQANSIDLKDPELKSKVFPINREDQSDIDMILREPITAEGTEATGSQIPS